MARSTRKASLEAEVKNMIDTIVTGGMVVEKVCMASAKFVSIIPYFRIVILGHEYNIDESRCLFATWRLSSA